LMTQENLKEVNLLQYKLHSMFLQMTTNECKNMNLKIHCTYIGGPIFSALRWGTHPYVDLHSTVI